MPLPHLPMPTAYPSVVAMLDRTADAFPDRPAVIFGDDTLSYKALRACVAGLSAMLANHGARGCRVATCLPNSLLACIAPYAIAAAHAQHVPLNPQYTARELHYMLADASPRLLLVDDAVYAKLPALLEQLPGCQVLRASELLARVQDWRGDTGIQTLAALYPAPDELAMLQYTGGSSGFPKGVNLTHQAINSNIAQREALLPVARGTETVLCAMPLFHSYAMAMGLYLCGYSGSTLVVLPAYHPARVLEAIAQQHISIFPGSPTIFSGLMAHPAFADCDWRRVHTCYSGSAPLSAETMERWQSATGSSIFEGYGQTEAGPILTFNSPLAPVKIGSVGFPVPDTRVEIVDVERGHAVLPPGDIGEVRAQGPQVMRGYHNLPLDTAAALRDGWLYTGDIGEFDDEGYLYIRDRKKDLVIVGGYNVYPREVEEVLFTHPKVMDTAVVGQPDDYRGEILRAFVVMRPGQLFDLNELVQFCKANLAPYKVPTQIDCLEALPKTSVNKTDKKVLKAAAPTSRQGRQTGQTRS